MNAAAGGSPSKPDELERTLLIEARRHYGTRRGDAAFTQLVERVQHGLLGQIQRSVRNSERSLELLQETLLKAYRSLPGFRMQARFRTWTGRIARNLCIDESRREAVGRGADRSLDQPVAASEGSGDVRSLIEPLASQDPGPVALLEREEARNRVRAAIDRLPDIYREIIQLRAYEGLPYTEIAQLVECQVGAAKQRMYQATNLLREQLGEA